MSEDEASRDEDKPFLTLPLAAIKRRIDDAMPSGMRASKASCEAINACCTHLIQMVASEANRQSMKASKRTVSGEHMEQAIEVILPEFLEEAGSHSKSAASGRKKKGSSAEEVEGAEQGERKRKKKRKKLTKEEEEELAKEQEALFQGLVMPPV